MKIVKITLGVLVVIVVLLGLGLQLFLSTGLTNALNTRVFPAVKEKYGLDVSITRASVNLLKGSAALEGLTVRNLKNYEEPNLLTIDRCVIDIEMLSLLKHDPIVIERAVVKGATLVIEQNKESSVNIEEIASTLKPADSEPSDAPQPEEPPQTPAPAPEKSPAKPVPLHIRRFAMDARVNYIEREPNTTYTMEINLSGSDLFSVPTAGQPSSLLVLRGSVSSRTNTFTADLNAILEPLVDLENPSFKATGSVTNIDPALLGDLLEKNNMQSRSFDISPTIICTKGQLKGSRVDIALHDLKIYDTAIGETTLKMPLSGTLKQPEIDLTAAIQSLFSEQGLKLGAALGLHELRKQLKVGTNSAPLDAVTSDLTNSINQIANSPALGELLQQTTSVAQPANSEASSKPTGQDLVGQLDKAVKELEDNKELKNSLKGLGNSLLGK